MTDIFLWLNQKDVSHIVTYCLHYVDKSNIRLSDLVESIGCGTVGSKVAEGEKHLNNLTLRG